MNGLRQTGTTLIELVISIVIIGIAASGVLLALNQTTRHSADPMLNEQAVAIAQSYLEEVMLQAYSDPGGPAEGGRADFDDVDDYHGLADNGGAVDREGNLVPGLSPYNIAITVSATTLNGTAAKRIDVDVSHDGFPELAVALSAYRTNY